MGHYYTAIKAVGKNRQEAEASAIHDFFYEHGHRHSLREIESAKFVRKVPPKKEVRKDVSGGWRGHLNVPYVRIEMVEDQDAPPEQWLEEWEFVLHTHT